MPAIVNGDPRPRRVLYIQHAPLGGSAMSLYYTVTALDPARWAPVVALIKPTPEIVKLFRDRGIECLEWPGIRTLEHSTLDWMRWWSPRDWLRAAQVTGTLRTSVQRMRALLAHVRPDLVHLNAVVLLPAALALRGWHGPWVWHVREPPVRGVAGVRTAWIGRALARWPDQAIFISEADRRAWVGPGTGVVIHNYVDLEQFRPGGANVRAELGIAADAPVVVYLGGISGVKGVEPLVEALAELRRTVPGVRCIMPGTLYEPSRSLTARVARRILPLLGTGTLSQRVNRRIREAGLEEVCVRLPFRPDIAPVLAAADVVTFPALRPHFPRPAVEAAALGKPVVASNLRGIDEVVADDETGYLTPPGDAAALAGALARVLLDRPLARALGARARERAEALFDRKRQVARITDIYEGLLR